MANKDFLSKDNEQNNVSFTKKDSINSTDGVDKSISKMGAFFKMIKDPESAKWKKILAVVSIVYIISPIDIVPEFFLPVLGYIDDATVLISTIAAILAHLNRYKKNL
jgi:uncharacterized membrane protein YkvA (DUF1232 family)